MNSYRIPYSKVGHVLAEYRDLFVERAVSFFVDRIGVQVWEERRRLIYNRLNAKNAGAPEIDPVLGISLRDRCDEFGWYLFLAEQSIADPCSVETDQASRVLPYFHALGRNLEAMLQIKNIEDRLRRMVVPVPDQDPDQGIFELLVGARYVCEAWDVEAVPEGSSKTPDFCVRKGGLDFDIECKRLSRRSEYTGRERDAWLRQWEPACKWLVASGLPLVVTVIIHVEVEALPENYLLNVIQQNTKRLIAKQDVEVPGMVTLRATPADMESIRAAMSANYVKCSSSRERQVVTGQHLPDFGLTYVVGGSRVNIGVSIRNTNAYWDKIDFVVAAYWKCDASAALEAKARTVVKHLSKATRQLSGFRPGLVHIGIEASEGDQVEAIRSERIDKALATFDPMGKPLEWVFLHYFKGEAPPDENWTIDETCVWRRMRDGNVPMPLANLFLVLPDAAESRPGVHWGTP
jgi:hypothetical protein